MKAPVITGLSVVCVAAAVTMASADASAQTHYYATIWNNFINEWPDVGKGAAINIRTDNFYINFVSPCSAMINHEMWYGLDQYNPNQHWIEVGFKTGLTDSGCIGPSGGTGFWADSNENGFYEHLVPNSWSFGTWYQALVEMTSSNECSWNVWLGGILIGTSTSNCPGSGRSASAGVESINPVWDQMKGFLTDWQEENTNGWWHWGWDGTPAIHSDNPPNIVFTDSSDSETEETLND